MYKQQLEFCGTIDDSSIRKFDKTHIHRNIILDKSRFNDRCEIISSKIGDGARVIKHKLML